MQATFVPGQKGTNLIEDYNKFRYRIHHKLSDNKTFHYKCVKKAQLKCGAYILYDSETNLITANNGIHCHENGLIKNSVKTIEKRYIDAAVAVGSIGTKRVIEEIKTTLDVEHQELVSSMSKSRAISSMIYNKKRKLNGDDELKKCKTLDEIRRYLEENVYFSGVCKFLCHKTLTTNSIQN